MWVLSYLKKMLFEKMIVNHGMECRTLFFRQAYVHQDLPQEWPVCRLVNLPCMELIG